MEVNGNQLNKQHQKTIKENNYATGRRFKGTGENHGFSARREYYLGGYPRVLVWLRSYPHMGARHRCGRPHPDELPANSGTLLLHALYKTLCRGALGAFVSGHERREG